DRRQLRRRLRPDRRRRACRAWHRGDEHTGRARRCDCGSDVCAHPGGATTGGRRRQARSLRPLAWLVRGRGAPGCAAGAAGAARGSVGLGRIGAAVARRASGFELRVLYTQRRRVDTDLGEYRELEDLLRESDVVTIHAPRTPETEGLIDERRLALLRNGATL